MTLTKVSRFILYGRGGNRTYHLMVYKVSAWRWLLGKLYHWYDMRIPCRVPGWKRFDRFLQRHGADIDVGFVVDDEEPDTRLRTRLRSWPYRQDLRCHDLISGPRELVASFQVDQETYEKVRG